MHLTRRCVKSKLMTHCLAVKLARTFSVVTIFDGGYRSANFKGHVGTRTSAVLTTSMTGLQRLQLAANAP